MNINAILGITILFVLFVYYILNTNYNKRDSFIIKTLIRGCSRWAIASKQDKSPLIALLHANYASGYLWAIKDVFTNEDIHKWTGVNIIDYQDKITSIQDDATKRVSEICPTFAKEILFDKQLAILAGNV
jgi:PDZ domain-containing secreted protein